MSAGHVNSLFGIPLLPRYNSFILLEQNNTYGFFPVNLGTFNQTYRNDATYPKLARDIAVTILAIHNLVLNILSYSHLNMFSGVCRILTGASLCIYTLTAGERRAQEGFPIQHWYDESLVTGAAQIMRGMIDVCIPFGCLVNTALDGVNAGARIIRFFNDPYEFDSARYRGRAIRQHSDPLSSQFLMCVNAVAMPILFISVLSEVLKIDIGDLV